MRDRAWPRPERDGVRLKLRSNSDRVELRVLSEPEHRLTLSHQLAGELGFLLLKLVETRH